MIFKKNVFHFYIYIYIYFILKIVFIVVIIEHEYQDILVIKLNNNIKQITFAFCQSTI